jgi:glycerol-3-phosphate dehydrogenase (NAD(P)+)
MRGFLMATSLGELDAIVRVMGGNAGSSYGLAGLGDLVTTATSVDSHHHELGRRLARGEAENISGEGVHTLEMIEQHGLFEWRSYPLFSLIKSLVSQPQSVESEILEFARKNRNNNITLP